MPFEPQITITESQIHKGRHTFLFHYPGDVSERYGLIPDVSLSVALDKYIGVLGNRFKRDHRNSDVSVPTAQEISAVSELAPKANSVIDNFAVSRTPGYISIWERMRDKIAQNGPMTKRDVLVALGCSDAAFYQAMNKHSDIFQSDGRRNGYVSLATGPRVAPVSDNRSVAVETPVDFGLVRPVPPAVTPAVTPIKQAASTVTLREDAARRSWEDRLLDKFPDFDPTWPDSVAAGWFSAFQNLMLAKAGVRQQLGRTVIG